MNGVLVAQVNALVRLVDLWNANAAGVAFENRRRDVEEFSELGPNDTGRTEVRGVRRLFFVSEVSSLTGIIAALLTLQIRKWWSHLGEFKCDVANQRNLRRLVHQWAKLLKYL